MSLVPEKHLKKHLAKSIKQYRELQAATSQNQYLAQFIYHRISDDLAF